jgi:hypothetical protein
VSHIVTIETKLHDLGAIRAACSRLGFTFVEGQQSYKWYGEWVGDTPMPEGMSKADLGKCNHAIRVPGASYEVGVVQHPSGAYTLAWDWWGDGGLLPHMGDQKAGRFMQAYGIEVARRAATRAGHTIRGERVLADGTIRLQVEAR